MKTWTKAACLTLCAGLLVSGVAAGLLDPKDDLKKQVDNAKKQIDDAAKKAQPKGEKLPGGSDKDAMMAMMMEMAQPAAEHAIIKSFDGTWTADLKMWMDPTSTEPTEAKGEMKCSMLHGDRYLIGHFTSTFNSMPFSGTLMWGYNRIDKRYESTWCDAWGTGLMMTHGQPSKDGKSIESTGTFRMPDAEGKLVEITQREKTTMLAKDKFFQEMWHATKEGEKKVMEITYTRPAAKPAAPGIAPGGAGITMPPATR